MPQQDREVESLHLVTKAPTAEKRPSKHNHCSIFQDKKLDNETCAIQCGPCPQYSGYGLQSQFCGYTGPKSDILSSSRQVMQRDGPKSRAEVSYRKMAEGHIKNKKLKYVLTRKNELQHLHGEQAREEELQFVSTSRYVFRFNRKTPQATATGGRKKMVAYFYNLEPVDVKTFHERLCETEVELAQDMFIEQIKLEMRLHMAEVKKECSEAEHKCQEGREIVDVQVEDTMSKPKRMICQSEYEYLFENVLVVPELVDLIVQKANKKMSGRALFKISDYPANQIATKYQFLGDIPTFQQFEELKERAIVDPAQESPHKHFRDPNLRYIALEFMSMPGFPNDEVTREYYYVVNGRVVSQDKFIEHCRMLPPKFLTAQQRSEIKHDAALMKGEAGGDEICYMLDSVCLSREHFNKCVRDCNTTFGNDFIYTVTHSKIPRTYVVIGCLMEASQLLRLVTSTPLDVQHRTKDDRSQFVETVPASAEHQSYWNTEVKPRRNVLRRLSTQSHRESGRREMERRADTSSTRRGSVIEHSTNDQEYEMRVGAVREEYVQQNERYEEHIEQVRNEQRHKEEEELRRRMKRKEELQKAAEEESEARAAEIQEERAAEEQQKEDKRQELSQEHDLLRAQSIAARRLKQERQEQQRQKWLAKLKERNKSKHDLLENDATHPCDANIPNSAERGPGEPVGLAVSGDSAAKVEPASRTCSESAEDSKESLDAPTEPSVHATIQEGIGGSPYLELAVEIDQDVEHRYADTLDKRLCAEEPEIKEEDDVQIELV